MVSPLRFLLPQCRTADGKSLTEGSIHSFRNF